MATVLDDLGTFLQTAGVGTLATDLFLGIMPGEPDTCVALIESPGDDPVSVMTRTASKPPVERPSISILCRGAKDDHNAPRVEAESIYAVIHNVVDNTLSGTRYLSIEARQPPFSIGRDENGRSLIGFNVDIWKEPNA